MSTARMLNDVGSGPDGTDDGDDSVDGGGSVPIFFCTNFFAALCWGFGSFSLDAYHFPYSCHALVMIFLFFQAFAAVCSCSTSLPSMTTTRVAPHVHFVTATMVPSSYLS